MNTSFTSLAIVAATAFVAPLLLGLVPQLPLPSIVVEIGLGILIGPSVLGWANADEPVQVMSLIGLSFLLLIAGLEVDYERFRGKLLQVTGLGFGLSIAIGLVIGLGLDAVGLVRSPLLIAIMFSATGLGIVIAVLRDAGQVESSFGQLVIAGSSIAEVGTIVLLTLLFSGESNSVGARVVLLGLFALLCLVVVFTVARLERSMRVMETLVRLQDTTAQIRVRGAFVLLAVFVVLASKFGLEAILGAFLAGATLRFVDRDQAMTHPQFRQKLDAAGFGVFIPFFFVTSGIRYDAGALFAHGSTLARVPLFLAILLAVRGLPALLYRSLASGRETAAGAFLQATSVGFLVVASRIGQDMGLISAANAAAVVAAGLLSVILFPLAALTVLGRDRNGAIAAETVPA
ncbi:MAG: cation:proton antiporter [Actinobacteria bacterium]|nr:MAG: cation:proton antiporter [Actinomycetota bacterium]